VFGAASSQIHFNMSGLFEPATDDRNFVNRIENLLLLTVCIVLRTIQIFEQSGNTIATACGALRTDFDEVFPNSYASSVLGAAEIGDIVNVFAVPDNFTGLVLNKRLGNPYASYEIEPIRQATPEIEIHISPFGQVTIRRNHNIGRKGWYGDIETMLCLRRADQEAIVQQAIAAGFVQAGQVIPVLAQILKTQEGYDRYAREPMNRVIMPELFFVQRMLSRQEPNAAQ
jgi:hypothetical protein